MKPKKKLYEIFNKGDLVIAEKIQQRRNQMLIHSYLYYVKDINLVTDYKWSQWAQELRQLQNDYPKIASKVAWAKEFKDWDGSSGAFLPLQDPWVVKTAEWVKEITKC